MAYQKHKYRQLKTADSKPLALDNKASATKRLDVTMANYIAVLQELAPTDDRQNQNNVLQNTPLTLSRWVK